jgi:predicted Rossmann fold flavoprotein
MPEVVIIGGGAAGIFTAIQCKLLCPAAMVSVYEQNNRLLQKVKISGGGRCNVTHGCFDPRELCKYYPRGAKELLGPFHKFGPAETIAFFEERGVPLKMEEDGRMFPVSDSSQDIINCFLHQADILGISIHLEHKFTALHHTEQGFKVEFNHNTTVTSRRVVIATGAVPSIWEIIHNLGHNIVAPVPSLFTFQHQNQEFKALSGISQFAALAIEDSDYCEDGSLLFTHRGVSGPAVLRLSAHAARELHSRRYTFVLRINWWREEDAYEFLHKMRQTSGKKLVRTCPPTHIARRLWEALCGRYADMTWAMIDKEAIQTLYNRLTNTRIEIIGKDTFKEEFVTSGGIARGEIDFRSMESKLCEGLYFAGEVIDIDALTGGFNFQACWTEGFLIGKHLANQ